MGGNPPNRQTRLGTLQARGLESSKAQPHLAYGSFGGQREASQRVGKTSCKQGKQHNKSMKKRIHSLTGLTPLSFLGQAIATAIVFGGIGLMVLLYLNSPTISGERLF